MPDENRTALSEPRRLDMLRRLHAEHDAAIQEAYDRLTWLASAVLQVPIVLVSLVEEDRQVFPSAIGLPEPWATDRQTPLSHSFCKHAVASGEPLIIEDAREHPLVRENPAVPEIGIVAYAGIPLQVRGGQVLGSFCVIDTRPRRWTAREIEILQGLAASVMTELDAWLDAAEARAVTEHLELLERAIAAVNEGILLTDARLPDNPIVFANPGFERITGYTAEEVMGRNCRFLQGDGTDPAVVARIREAVRTQQPLTVEIRNHRKDGTPFWNVLSITPVRGAGGEVTHFAGVQQDTTRFRQVREHLAAAEQRYRRLVKMLPVAIYALDAEGRCTEANVAMARVTGRSTGELVGLHFTELVPPEDRPAAEQAFRSMVSGEFEDLEAECRVLQPSGELRVAAVNASTIREGDRIAGVHGVLRDVTEGKAAEAALLASEARYRRFFAEAITANLLSTPDGRIVECNPAFARIFGCDSVGEARSLHLDTVYGDPGARAVFVERIRREKRIEHHEQELRSRDGTPVQVIQNAYGIFDERGELVQIQKYIFDITEHKRLEEQLRQAQKMEAVGQLAGGVAHDFNNMLTAISGHAQLILADLSQDDPVRADLREILDAAERSASLTRQLLAFSRKQILQPRPTTLNEIVTGMEGMLRRLIGEDVEFTTNLDPDAAAVLADPGQLEQVLMNLAVNARDAMPLGGKLVMETGSVALESGDATAGVSEFSPGRHAVLAVTDTGTGMDPDTRAKIFEPFFTTKPVGKGTGLGLSTVYGIVKQSGGFVDVQSEPGAGTTFRIYLPAVAAEPSHEAASDAGAAAHGRETVLLVEDEAAVRSLVGRILSNAGYTVLAAGSGEQALQMAAGYDDTIHLALTDVVMPQMGGKEFVGRLIGLRPGIRTLLMSGYTDDANADQGVLDAGTEFLQKPFTPGELLGTVRKVLDATH